MIPGSIKVFTQRLIYLFIIFGLAGFINPSYSLAKSNNISSSQVDNYKKAKKKCQAKKKKSARKKCMAQLKNANTKKTAEKKSKSSKKKTAEKKSKSSKKKTAKKKSKSSKKKTAKKKSKSGKKKTAKKKSKSSKKKTAKNSVNPPNSIEVDPLRDLGMDKGYVCFRIKSYSNTDISNFSKPACTNIKNSDKFILAWAHGSGIILGYQVYFGKSAKKTNSYLTDVY